MESSHLVLETKKILKQRNYAVMVCGALLCSNLFLSAVVMFDKKEVVLVPNSLTQEASIINGKMSAAYMEAMTRDVINLMLNVTPSNIEYTTKSVLKITHPHFYGKLKTSLQERSQDVINRRISIYFSPQTIVPSPDKSGALVVGKLSTYLGKEEVSSEDKTYSITYAFEGFRPLVIDFHEIDIKDNNGGSQ